MTITQTVEVPSDRSITLEVPHEILTSKVVLTFSPISEADNPRYNAMALAAIAEAEAKIKGEAPVNWYKPHELEDVWKEMLED